MPLPILPNGKVVLRQALLAQVAVTGSPIGNRIYYAIPAPLADGTPPTYPLWVLTMVDDIEARPETLAVRVQVDIWGTGPTTLDVIATEDSAAVLRSVVRDLDGDWAGGKIRACTAGTTIPSPDPSGRARLIVDLEFQLNQ